MRLPSACAPHASAGAHNACCRLQLECAALRHRIMCRQRRLIWAGRSTEAAPVEWQLLARRLRMDTRTCAVAQQRVTGHGGRRSAGLHVPPTSPPSDEGPARPPPTSPADPSLPSPPTPSPQSQSEPRNRNRRSRSDTSGAVVDDAQTPQPNVPSDVNNPPASPPPVDPGQHALTRSNGARNLLRRLLLRWSVGAWRACRDLCSRVIRRNGSGSEFGGSFGIGEPEIQASGTRQREDAVRTVQEDMPVQWWQVWDAECARMWQVYRQSIESERVRVIQLQASPRFVAGAWAGCAPAPLPH